MLYIFDKSDLSVKQITKVSTYSINSDEETSGKSTFKIIKQVDVIKGDLCYYKNNYFLINSVEDVKGESMISLSCVDMVHLFDRNIIEENIDDMTTKSLEEFIGQTMVDNFIQTTDPFMNVDYMQVSVLTQNKVKEPTNSDNMIYNFKTFIVNCRQNKDIFVNFEIVQLQSGNILQITIEKKTLNNVLIDTTVSEVTNYNKVYEVEPKAKVKCLCRDTMNVKYLYLKSDYTTTDNMNDPLRIHGLVQAISVDTEDKANDEMLNIFKGNRYNHYVEFKIKKSSKLVDTESLIIGTPIKIKTFGINEVYDVYDSYISAIGYSDDEFVYYKSGKLRVTLTDKLIQNKPQTIGNKLDITGGNITGDLTVQGVKVVGYQYSTTEQWTGKYDDDGSKIYGKKFNINQTFSKANTDIPHGISNIGNYRECVKAQFNTPNTKYQDGAYENQYAFVNVKSISDTAFTVQLGQNWYNVFNSATVILEYTKK